MLSSTWHYPLSRVCHHLALQENKSRRRRWGSLIRCEKREVIGRPGNPELANRQLAAAFVNNERSLSKIVSPGFVRSVRRLFCVDFKPGLRNLGSRGS